MKKVFVVGGDFAIEHMFRREKWEVTRHMGDADLVQFTGGEDVDPALYGEDRQEGTYFNAARDEFEQSIYNKCLRMGKPMAGICRGGQLLNVLNGGRMWQHIPDNSHCSGSHDVFLTPTAMHLLNIDVADEVAQKFKVTSTHHQMMVPAAHADILGLAFECKVPSNPNDADMEIVLYRDTRSLCFQPHPEYPQTRVAFVDLYFKLVDDLLNDKPL